MRELNAEEIKKALECCASSQYKCEECPIDKQKKDDCACGQFLEKNALALIKELTEENEAISERYAIQVVTAIELDKQVQRLTEFKEITRADTVREMAERLRARKVSYGNITFKVVPIDDIDQIAKEMLEGT